MKVLGIIGCIVLGVLMFIVIYGSGYDLAKENARKSTNKYEIIIIDSCEYIKSTNPYAPLIHKANCINHK